MAGGYYCIACTTRCERGGCGTDACGASYFPSKIELERAAHLALLQRAREISAVKVHPRFDLVVNGTKVGTYVADFQYVRDGKSVIEDVKPDGEWQKYDRLAALKIAVFAALHPGQIVNIHQP